MEITERITAANFPAARDAVHLVVNTRDMFERESEL